MNKSKRNVFLVSISFVILILLSSCTTDNGNSINNESIETVSAPEGDRFENIALAYPYLYVTGLKGLSVITLSEECYPSYKNTFNYKEDCYNNKLKICVNESSAFIMSYDSIICFDLTNPAKPEYIGAFKVFEEIISMKPVGNYVYLVTKNSKLKVLNVENNRNIFETSHCNLIDIPKYIEVEDNYAYVADGESGLAIFDISDVDCPTKLVQLDTPGYAVNIVLKDSILFLSDFDKGILVFDISNKKEPESLYCIKTAEAYEYLALSEHYLFAVTNFRWMEVYDISNPSKPFCVWEAMKEDDDEFYFYEELYTWKDYIIGIGSYKILVEKIIEK